MDYISGLGNSVTGAFGSATQSAANVAPSNGLSSFFGKADEKEQDTPAPGSATNAGPPTGGRRRKQCGGSFHPYTPSSDLSSTASVFKGGKRKTYRKKSHRKSHKKSRRKSHRKRR